MWRVIVQSHVFDATHVQERISAWIDSLKKELEEISDENFQDYVSSLVIAKLEKDKSLNEEFGRWKSEIEFPRAADFGRAEVEAKEIQKITKKDVLEFYQNFIAKNGIHRKKIECTCVFYKKTSRKTSVLLRT